MTFDVVALTDAVDFAPASVVEEVLQNVRTLLATRVGTVPMDRNLGIDWAFLDMPMAQSVATMNAEVVRKIKRYEPRARVIRIVVDNYNAEEGSMRPRVTIGVEA